jgi:hypothetical protein
LPGVTITEQGEYKIWQETAISETALVVTADAVLGDAETHFSRHRFERSELPYYFLRDEYITSKKYPSLDEVDSIAVLGQERPEILALLRRQK